jgi:hypothetical protein
VKDNIFVLGESGIRTGGRFCSFPRVVFRPPPPLPHSPGGPSKTFFVSLIRSEAVCLVVEYSPSPPSSGRVRRRLEIFQFVCCLLRLLQVLFVRIHLILFFFVCFKFIRCESCGCWLRLVSFVKFNNILQPSLLPSEHCLTILLLLSQHQHPSILPSEVLVASPCCCCYDRHPVGSSDRTPAQVGKFRGQALRAHRSHYPFLPCCQAATSQIGCGSHIVLQLPTQPIHKKRRRRLLSSLLTI